MSELIREECWTCDGTGRVRNNKSANGTYTFGSKECDDCGGSGMLDYQKCSDCGSVIPAFCFDNHECDD